MARRVLEKNTFSTGELAPELWGRSDLSAYANGAARLRNVFIEPSGGVRRRPGIRLIDELPGPARLIQFEFNTEQTYLLAFEDKRALVFEDGVETIWFELDAKCRYVARGASRYQAGADHAHRRWQLANKPLGLA